jgi:hypothetical protein
MKVQSNQGMLTAIQKSPNFELKNEAGIGKSHKRACSFPRVCTGRMVADSSLYGPS